MIIIPEHVLSCVRHWPSELDRFVSHAFFERLCSNSIPAETWQRFLVQEVVYLPNFAAACALLSARSKGLGGKHIRRALCLAADAAMHDTRHLRRQLANQASANALHLTSATRSYCSFMLRAAAQGSVAEAMAGLSVCVYMYPLVVTRHRQRSPKGYLSDWQRSLTSVRASCCMESWSKAINDLGFHRRGCLLSIKRSLEQEIRFLDDVMAPPST